MPKPSQIIELEKYYNIKLTQVTQGYFYEISEQNTYKIDKNKNVISLNLEKNKISDITILETFIQLKHLDLGNNLISDISSLGKLTNLAKLNLHTNQISILPSLKGLNKLAVLNLWQNNIRNISPLINLISLNELYLDSNQLSDVSGIAYLSNLKSLSIADNQISDISAFENLAKLSVLSLRKNQISNLIPLTKLTGLTSLDLAENNIIDCSALSNLVKMYDLSLADNNISDFSALEKMRQLTVLNLSNNRYFKHLPLGTFRKLRYLDLSDSRIIHAGFLKELPHLEVLILNNNLISDLSFVNELKELKTLYLDNNQISDLLGIKNFKSFEELSLNDNFISDISQFNFLTSLPKIQIYVYNNPCIVLNNIILEKDKNHYSAILNELKKREDVQIAAVLPEKIILLGNHASGKSSLLHYLQNKNLRCNHDTTHILKVEKYPKNYKTLPKAIIYDFGGQDFYHGIYNAFLTPNSITLILWNEKSNRNQSSIDKHQRSNMTYNVDYWLGQQHYRDSKDETVIIQTHSDEKNSSRYSYINNYNYVESEFYISLKSEKVGDTKNILKHSGLQYLKNTIDDIIEVKQKFKNNDREISLPYYNFLNYILSTSSTHRPIKKSQLRRKYEISDDSRFEEDLQQLERQGLILIQDNNIWINPITLVEYVHREILKPDLVGNGIIEKSDFEKNKFDKSIVNLLIKQKVIFLHLNGLSKDNKKQEEYIIPNYLPLITESGIDYDLMIFGLDNPLFILKFQKFIPFGLINQMICYFGKLPDKKKFWRDNLIFTINDQAKVLIKLDFENLEVHVFAVFEKNALVDFKNNIEKYMFYSIMALYWNFSALPSNLEDYLKIFDEYRYDKIKSTFVKIEGKSDEYLCLADFYSNENCRPVDLFLSKDGKHFINYKELGQLQDNETKISSYKLDIDRNLLIGRELPLSIYQNFTHRKLSHMKKVFISYSNEDHYYKNLLEKNLKPLSQFQLLQSWSCEEMTSGNWHDQIQDELEKADIVIFMMSLNFITSDYIMREEVYKTFQSIKDNPDKKILCILVKNFPWNLFGKFRTLTNLSDEDLFKLQNAATLTELASKQFIPYFIENKGDKENEKRYLHPLNKWKYEEDAYVEIINQLSNLL